MGVGVGAQCFGNSLHSVMKCMSHELSSLHIAHEKKRYQRSSNASGREKREREWGWGGGWGGRENHSALVFPLTLE